MGRLFWKFFLFIWLAQLSVIAGIGSTIWLREHTQGKRSEEIDTRPSAAFLVESAAATLQYGGIAALRQLIQNMPQHQVYVIDEHEHELLGRNIAAAVIDDARLLLSHETNKNTVRRLRASDGQIYLIFVPYEGERHEGAPPPYAGSRPPRPDPFFLTLIPVAAAMLASLIFAALLAWYFSKPIRTLRAAFESLAAGNLEMQLAPAMGKRRDELADLGRDFDSMAQRIRALMDAQRRLLHDVSHEMRSPLARLQAAISLARQQPDKLEPSMERIEREGLRMDTLVGELLTLSRLEAGVVGSMTEEIRLGELLSDIVDDARFEAEVLGRAVELSGSCEVVVSGNTELLLRAIENVIRNAVKHTVEGTSVTITSSYDESMESLRLIVMDKGPGVPEAELTAIFQPFFRSGGARSTDGHGLGLTIAKRVIEAHGGVIRAFNRPDGGLRIEIVLPSQKR
ncbi:MAG TPA: ATP-binding protein [Rhodocyclaceae bacterium]|nr:ATP-binding protein [Rhodocyclaceae bacterium]